MEITSELKDLTGNLSHIFTYKEGDPEENLGDIPLGGVRTFCFYEDKLVIVSHGENVWTIPGGGIEKGETYQEAIAREVKEESNMNVLYTETIGYQDILTVKKNTYHRQVMAFCIVKPFGDFISDPDGDIVEIKLIDPKDYREYIKWGEVADYLIRRSAELLTKYKK